MISTHYNNEADASLSPVVESIGEGAENIVFLHGLLGINEYWMGVVNRLSDEYRCLLLELPLLELRGETCTVQGATDIVVGVLQETVRKPAVLVGNSLGGHMAMRIALDYPDLVSALVLAGSSGMFERTFEKDVQHRPNKEWIERKIRDLFHDPSKAPKEAINRAYDEISKRPAARSLVRLSKSAKADHMGERMQAIAHPTLLLWGKQDIVTPPSVAEEFQTRIPNAQLRWIDNCGHAPMIEQPEVFATELLQFLTSVFAPDSSTFNPTQEVA